MKTLALEFDRNGWHHKSLLRLDDVAIYERWKDTSANHHFEVIIIKACKERESKGIVFKAQELYPSDNQFGDMGWTFPTLEKAQARYDELTKPVVKKIIKKKVSHE